MNYIKKFFSFKVPFIFGRAVTLPLLRQLFVWDDSCHGARLKQARTFVYSALSKNANRWPNRASADTSDVHRSTRAIDIN